MSAEKKFAHKINPAIGTEGSKRGHFLTIKMVVTKKYEFSWDVLPGGHVDGGQ